MTLSRRWPTSDTLDELFVEHYATMIARAQQLVGRDRQAAEDLVHDAYVRLALRELDMGAVHNVEGYLFMTLRNVHLSQVRRRMSKVSATVSIIDHESAVSGLRSLASDEERHAAYDALRHVVRYACLRKSTSKAASVLILRFFHGYYSGEIARVVQTSEAAVAGRLRLARAEARAYLADPSRLRVFDRRRAPQRLDAQAWGDSESVVALRQAIFDACVGTCLSHRALDRLYGGQASDPLDVAALAHLVSCAACLDTVNHRLGLPRLADRDPSDKLGRGGPSHGSGGRGVTSDLASVLRTRLEDAREDHPQELQIAVNGLFVGSQAVNGPVNEQRLKILVTEQVGFIEIFDEHDTCLLYLDVEPPPHGAVEQAARVHLSGGRQLSAILAFSDASPTLHVVYDNPSADLGQQTVGKRAEHTGDEALTARTWSLWPVPFRFVIAGIILGVLLANPMQTLAAVERARRAIVDSITQLLETERPRAVLLSRPVTGTADVTRFALPAVSVSPLASRRPPTVSEEATDLELAAMALETLRLLDSVGALTMEQVGVERGADRRVHVEGVVDSEARRRELTAVLRVLPARRVRVDLVTIGEAARQPSAAPAIGPLRSVQTTRDREPAAYEHVRRYLIARAATEPAADASQTARSAADASQATRPAADASQTTRPAADAAVSNAVQRFSSALLSRSLRARVHGRTVRELVFSVSSADADHLPPAARATWRELVHRHAELFRQETASLGRELDQVFSPAGHEDDAAVAPNGDVWHIAARMFDLASAHDVAVRRAFAVSADGNESLDVSTPAFRRSLLEAERLAEALVTAVRNDPNPAKGSAP